MLLHLLLPANPHPQAVVSVPKTKQRNPIRNSTGERHIYWHKTRKVFYIHIQGKRLFKSGLKTIEEAVVVRDQLLAQYETQNGTSC